MALDGALAQAIGQHGCTACAGVQRDLADAVGVCAEIGLAVGLLLQRHVALGRQRRTAQANCCRLDLIFRIEGFILNTFHLRKNK